LAVCLMRLLSLHDNYYIFLYCIISYTCFSHFLNKYICILYFRIYMFWNKTFYVSKLSLPICFIIITIDKWITMLVKFPR
jgi:hypothetical protein